MRMCYVDNHTHVCGYIEIEILCLSISPLEKGGNEGGFNPCYFMSVPNRASGFIKSYIMQDSVL